MSVYVSHMHSHFVSVSSIQTAKFGVLHALLFDSCCILIFPIIKNPKNIFNLCLFKSIIQRIEDSEHTAEELYRKSWAFKTPSEEGQTGV